MDVVEGVRAPITILVAVAVRLYRDGLAEALGAHGHLRIGGTAGTIQEAEAAVAGIRFDVVIVDASFDDALAWIGALRAVSSDSRILVFAVRENIDAILEYARAGADGFVTASSSLSDLLEAIEKTAAGELCCSPHSAAQLLRQALRRPARPAENDAAHALTGRERQVFALIQQGRSNKEIGATLNIAEATVKNHVHQVLQKLRVTTRAKAIAAGAARHGSAST